MARIILRNGTSVAWSTKDPVLAKGEPGVDTETFVVKVGDGVKRWSALPESLVNSANLVIDGGAP